LSNALAYNNDIKYTVLLFVGKVSQDHKDFVEVRLVLQFVPSLPNQQKGRFKGYEPRRS
jgi:hypothetical protein